MSTGNTLLVYFFGVFVMSAVIYRLRKNYTPGNRGFEAFLFACIWPIYLFMVILVTMWDFIAGIKNGHK